MGSGTLKPSCFKNYEGFKVLKNMVKQSFNIEMKVKREAISLN